MTQPESLTYTIAEAAALTGLHKNTIRMRIKLGQIAAQRAQGKFGEEYRLTQAALIDAGLLTPPEHPSPLAATAPLEQTERAPAPSPDTPHMASQGALLDLFQRHEHSMYRLGWLEAEMARHKALAEHAESLQVEAGEKELENRELRRELERAQERIREIEELRSLVREMERDTERMREEVESHRAAASRRWWQFFPRKPPGG
jgi:excisionase family DNA binding protein